MERFEKIARSGSVQQSLRSQSGNVLCSEIVVRIFTLQANLQMVETLTAAYSPVDFCLLEAGGDNLSANFSRELADYIIYVVRG